MKEQNLLTELTDDHQGLKYFHILAIIYVAGMMTSLTVSARLFPFHIPLTHFTILLTGGTWTIPLSFFIQDITTEVYGYSKSRELIQLAIVVLFFYVMYTFWISHLSIPAQKNIDASYNTIFFALPRHFLALISAIFIGNFVNDYIISKSKYHFQGKYLPLRFIVATAVGEAVLQLVGTSVAWFGSLDFKAEILPFVIFSYCYKVFFEALMTPVNMYVCNRLKKLEGIDVYDTNINYNPFSFIKKKIKWRSAECTKLPPFKCVQKKPLMKI
ncbi:MAG: hypothetical protein A3C44_00690 [Gammaproteobacteria bacterium RIFCSPHIGHO2_02_FULL_39_13]|nr:MAG: hypothetical protein A3C44_00690 [Gammaproteobacteria bacterium RIFCSPHIGHO2_02_FULL_39_13]